MFFVVIGSADGPSAHDGLMLCQYKYRHDALILMQNLGRLLPDRAVVVMDDGPPRQLVACMYHGQITKGSISG